MPSADFGKYLACMNKMLTPGGLLLLHRMTPSRSSSVHFRSLHPELPIEPLSKDLAVAESGGWELVDIETLASDYEETLRVWIGRLRQSASGAASAPGYAGTIGHAGADRLAGTYAHSYRAWLLYLVEVATSLHARELQVHRILLRRTHRARSVVC